MKTPERAVECRKCGATHLPNVLCPPVGRWLISGERVVTRDGK